MVKSVNCEIGEMVKPAGRKQNGEMLKPTGPKIDTNDKMAKPLSAQNGKIGKNVKRLSRQGR